MHPLNSLLTRFEYNDRRIILTRTRLRETLLWFYVKTECPLNSIYRSVKLVRRWCRHKCQNWIDMFNWYLYFASVQNWLRTKSCRKTLINVRISYNVLILNRTRYICLDFVIAIIFNILLKLFGRIVTL